MNVAEKLAREIARVTKLRGQYAACRGMVGVNVEPAIALMDAALGEAFAAAGVDDAIMQMAALRELEGFTG